MRYLLLPILFALAGCTVPPKPEATVTKTGHGTASWYHEGRYVATGARYNPDGYTTAHRTLPFGTNACVINRRNNQSVVVAVNDRGPAKWTGRDWDLSRGAARKIDMIGAGVVPITYQLYDRPVTAGRSCS